MSIPSQTFDSLSPISSSPKNSFKLPASVALRTPIKTREEHMSEIILEEVVEDLDASWTSTLFSPVLKLFAAENANEHYMPELSSSAEDVESKTPNEDDEAEDENGYYEFDPFIFISQLPPHHLVKNNVLDPKPLPKLVSDTKPTLILDLDETLVHCSADASSKYDVTFNVQFNGANCQVYVRKRPYLDEFLEKVSSKFEIVIFTASQRVYAERLLDILDPHKKLIHHRLYRESCLMVSGNLLKDLTILNRDLKKTIIIDNSPHAFGYQLENGIPIESWYEDPDDVELLKLLPILEILHRADDVRPYLRNLFRMADLVNEARNRGY